MAAPSAQKPATREELAAALGAANADGRTVRVSGAGTKLGWGGQVNGDALPLSTAGLDRTLEHNAGDLTAIVEAGTPLAEAQRSFAAAGQMLALDPPLARDDAATVGGVIATGDSGPLRQRYGSGRDLVIGTTVALADGTIARSGGKVIKNVAGYDLAKLFAGSFGTLGVIVELCLRLHPRPPAHVTALGSGSDSETLAGAASVLSHAALQPEALDIAFARGRGAVMARFGGAAAAQAAAPALELLRDAGLRPELREGDERLWASQRAMQRSHGGTVVRISGLQTQLEKVLEEARRLDASVVGRAGLGLSWVTLADRSPAEQARGVVELREAVSPSPCVVLDAPGDVRDRVATWPATEPGALELMRRVKQRFDPAGALNPGVLMGGI